jgi:phosphoserine aminotransferase
MLNTPPTYAIYIAGLVFEWLLDQGRLAAIERMNIERAACCTTRSTAAAATT